MSVKSWAGVVAAAMVAAAMSWAATSTVRAADDAASLLPTFGAEGAEVNSKGKEDHKVTGWLPKGWVDNSEWAQVNATYTKLSDGPKPDMTAVRVNVTAVDDGQLQMTSWTRPTFKKGVKYAIEGWIRSKEGSGIQAGVRQPGEPYEFYAQQDLTATDEWKPFTFEFTLDEDRPAFVMFVKQDTGTVDLAGIVVREVP